MVADRISLSASARPARLTCINRDSPDTAPNRLDVGNFPASLQVALLPSSPTPRSCKRVRELRPAAERREHASKVCARISDSRPASDRSRADFL
jgi:hypothetical protein